MSELIRRCVGAAFISLLLLLLLMLLWSGKKNLHLDRVYQQSCLLVRCIFPLNDFLCHQLSWLLLPPWSTCLTDERQPPTPQRRRPPRWPMSMMTEILMIFPRFFSYFSHRGGYETFCISPTGWPLARSTDWSSTRFGWLPRSAAPLVSALDVSLLPSCSGGGGCVEETLESPQGWKQCPPLGVALMVFGEDFH